MINSITYLISFHSRTLSLNEENDKDIIIVAILSKSYKTITLNHKKNSSVGK